MVLCPKCKVGMSCKSVPAGQGSNEDLFICPKCGRLEGSSIGQTREFDSRKLNKLIIKSTKKWWQAWK